MISKRRNTLSPEYVVKLVDERVDAAIARKGVERYDDMAKTVDAICEDMWNGRNSMDGVTIHTVKAIANYFFKRGVEFGKTGDCLLRFDSVKRNLF